MRSLSLFYYSFFLNRSPLSLSLSLSQKLPSLSLSFSLFTRSFLHRVLSSPADPDPFFTCRSTNQAPTTQILSSPADPRTNLPDLDHFFIDQSTNQTPQALIYLSLCWFVYVGLFVCECVSVLICLCGCVCVYLRKRRWGAEVVVHEEEREKLVRSEIIKIINTHATIIVYIYTITVAHKNIYIFLHIFTPTGVGVFLFKMCKTSIFFYFRRLYLSWWGCSKSL